MFFSMPTIALVAKAPAVERSPNAPADEYFGSLRMSALRIRIRIDQLGRRYVARSASDADLLHDAGLVATALDAWLARYPRDIWAAPTVFHLGELYAEIQTPEARAKARGLFEAVAARYGNSRFGHLARLRLAQGFPPLHAESPVVASPAPSASAGPLGAPSASPMPGANGSALPGAPATPVPTGASPAASASPPPHSPAPKAT